MVIINIRRKGCVSCLVWISGYCTFVVIDFLNEILKSTQSNRNASLKVKWIMRREKENSEELQKYAQQHCVPEHDEG